MKSTNNEQIFFTSNQVAERYGLSLVTLSIWRWQNKKSGINKGPEYVKLGHSVRYHIDDLIKWENKRNGN